jgi:diguanylate cyclase (GGDEF)-like protein
VIEPYETQVMCRDGQVLEVAVSLAPVLDEVGRVIGAASIGRDITTRKLNEETLFHQALHDPLTNLPNRNLIRDRLQLALYRTERSSAAVGVLFIDLDNFKMINDSAGHSAGDQVLRMIAERLVHAVRPDDTVGRFGGDEFVVVCPDIHDEDETFAVSRRIAKAFAVPFQLDGVRFDVTMSIGAVIGRSPDGFDELLRRADTAMYQEKQRRKLHDIAR